MADAAPVGQPRGQRAAALGARQGFVVGQVVGLAHEGIDGADGVAARIGERDKGVVEVLCLAFGDGPAVSVSRIQLGIVGQAAFLQLCLPRRRWGKSLPQTARSISASFLPVEMAGRAASTS